MFYLFTYDFSKQYDRLYADIWNDSFEHENLNDIFIPIFKGAIIEKQDDNKIKIQYEDLNIIIDNINDYCIEPLISHILSSKNDSNIYMLNNFLRIDKYDSCLFIKKNWKILSDYISRILISPVITSIFTLVCQGEEIRYHCFNKNEIKQIINNIRFFNFQSNFSAITKTRLLLIYAQANMKSDYKESINILIYLTLFIINLIHEIIGHLNVRFQQYLYLNKLKSPKPEKGSKYANERGAESGEFVEEELFGNYQGSMTVQQMLFLLDINNYNYIYHETFRQKFQEYNTLKITEISDELKEILHLFNIELREEDFKSNQLCFVQKNINSNKYFVGHYHSMDQEMDD